MSPAELGTSISLFEAQRGIDARSPMEAGTVVLLCAAATIAA